MKMEMCVAAVAAIFFGAAQAVQAMPSSPYSPGQVRGLCKGFGVYFGPARINHGIYGCLMDEDQGGGLLICGPSGDLKQTTCDIYAKAPPHRRGYMPTRTALNAAAKANPSILSPDPHGALMRQFGPGAHAMQKRR